LRHQVLEGWSRPGKPRSRLSSRAPLRHQVLEGWSRPGKPRSRLSSRAPLRHQVLEGWSRPGKPRSRLSSRAPLRRYRGVCEAGDVAARSRLSSRAPLRLERFHSGCSFRCSARSRLSSRAPLRLSQVRWSASFPASSFPAFEPGSIAATSRSAVAAVIFPLVPGYRAGNERLRPVADSGQSTQLVPGLSSRAPLRRNRDRCRAIRGHTSFPAFEPGSIAPTK
jgi:hypothetical protein